jgi:heme O synthase-like polyprenyltransferase
VGGGFVCRADAVLLIQSFWAARRRISTLDLDSKTSAALFAAGAKAVNSYYRLYDSRVSRTNWRPALERNHIGFWQPRDCQKYRDGQPD